MLALLVACGGETPEAEEREAGPEAAVEGPPAEPAAESEATAAGEDSFRLALSGPVELTLQGDEAEWTRWNTNNDLPEELKIELETEHEGEACLATVRVPTEGRAELEGTYTLTDFIESGGEIPTFNLMCPITFQGGTTRGINSTGGTVEITSMTDRVVEGTVNATTKLQIPGTGDMTTMEVTGDFRALHR